MLFWPLKLAIRIVSLFVSAIVIYLVVCGVQVVTASDAPTSTSALQAAQAELVIGAPAPAGNPGPTLLGRLQEALACYQAHLAPHIYLTTDASSTGSAQAAVAWLGAHGVPSSAVSAIGATDAAAGLSAMEGTLAPHAELIVVTDAVAAYWTRAVATHDGLTAEIAPAVGSEKAVYTEIGPLWTQASAVAVGRIVGFDRTTWAGH